MIACLRRSWGLRCLRYLPWIALAWLQLPSVAWADDPIAQARAAIAQSDYAAALPTLTAALDTGGRNRDKLTEIYQLSGVVEAALGDARAATDAFIHLLVLSPAATLPDDTSPKIKRLFDEAARYVASHGTLEIKFDWPDVAGPAAVIVSSDPLDMVATVRVKRDYAGGEDLEVTSERSARIEVAMPGDTELLPRYTVNVTVLDVHGNTLAGVVYQHDARPRAPVVPPSRPVVVQARPRPVYLRWWPYAAGGAVTLAATGYFALAARSARDDLDAIIAHSPQHTYGDARAVEDRGRRDVLLTNIGLGVTGALAITAGVLYLTRPHDHVETLSGIAPLPGGGQLVLGGSF
ncbi:MAG TPA: hypothetical protein VHW23_14620 [Kofleriaceae bacterium]|jgi:hypothetical protein|nr:hypothetical protein [Kofleriaceae bacterium]